jgi:ABC-type transporter Mla subunit MlaD
MQFIDNLMSVTRLVTGSTEVMTGEAQHAGQSGQAIANLQAQALKPIQELRDRYLRANKQAARIIKQYYEMFYEGKKFEYKTEDGKFIEEQFSGEEMNGTLFDITIEAGAGTPYSESLVVSLLTEYLGAGYIDYPTYLELLPSQIAVFKTTLLKKIKEGNMNQLKQAQEQIAALQEQLKQATASLQMMAQKMEAQGQAVEKVNNLINQNRALNNALADLYTEATGKINQANAVIKAQGAEYANVRRDAETMAKIMAEDDQLNMQSAEKEAQALSAMVEQ